MNATSRVQRSGVAGQLDRIVETGPGAALRGDDVSRHTQHVVGQRIGCIHLTAHRDRVIPSVNEKFKRQDARHHLGGRLAGAERHRAVEAAPFPGVQRRPPARTTCRSTESVRSRSGNSAPAAPPSTVIEFIRWSVRLATSYSRHGVCLSRSSSAIRAAHAPARRRSLRRIRVRPPAANRVLAGRSMGMLPRYVALAPIVAQMKTHVRVGAAALILVGLATGCSRTTEGTVAMTTEPGPPISARRHRRRRSRRFRDCRASRSPTYRVPGFPMPGIRCPRCPRAGERADHDVQRVHQARRGHPAGRDPRDPRRGGNQQGPRRRWRR